MIRNTAISLAAALLAMQTGTVWAQATPVVELRQIAKPQDVQLAFYRLLDTLHAAKAERPDGTSRNRIRVAARGLLEAISLDGGARDDLAAKVGNVIGSLSDGSFDAGKSIDALKGVANRNAIEAGAWLPEAMPGSWIEAPIGQIMHQGGIGDCVGISVVKALSTTPVGRAILNRTVKNAADGSFNVTLPGSATIRFNIARGDVTQYGAGDAPAGAIIGALFKDFGIDPKHGALPTNKAMSLLSMGFGNHRRFSDATANPQKIEAYLARYADHVGRDTAMVFGGSPDKDGAWSRGDGHAFAVLRIDTGAGMLTYTNPWDETRERTIPIAALARQAAGTGADFETVTFDAGVMTDAGGQIADEHNSISSAAR